MFHDWIDEARPQTLLLGSTNCALGCALGFYYGEVTLYTVITAFFVVVTGVLLQVVSNFANDYGDAYAKSDGEKRLGPIRAVMTGAISLSQLRKGMATVILLCVLSGLIALFLAVGNNIQVLAWFVFLGALSILAALFYTMGFAYGRKGLGDLFVLVFFGCVAVIGSQLLITSASGGGFDMYPDTFLLAFSAGCGSVMVLHVNAMRDVDEDRLSGKRTLAARMSYKASAGYLLGLFTAVTLTSCAACFYSHKGWEIFILLFSLVPLLTSTIRAVKNVRDGAKIAPELKFTSLGCSIHHIAWMVVLVVDYWVYY
ncbi:MAG: 1,4-dihydroxy-2-naphthoate octaprenyltransferase [Succinivibrio sp.]|nr:1,4-dihydroxy-2-naphthoate octaprenyltransferase [Succinivibrio sp.]